MITVEELKILTPLQKLPMNVGDWGKLIVAKGFKKLTKVQNIAQSGQTDPRCFSDQKGIGKCKENIKIALLPPSTPDFSGKVGLNLALDLVTSCCSCQTA